LTIYRAYVSIFNMTGRLIDASIAPPSEFEPFLRQGYDPLSEILQTAATEEQFTDTIAVALALHGVAKAAAFEGWEVSAMKGHAPLFETTGTWLPSAPADNTSDKQMLITLEIQRITQEILFSPYRIGDTVVKLAHRLDPQEPDDPAITQTSYALRPLPLKRQAPVVIRAFTERLPVGRTPRTRPDGENLTRITSSGNEKRFTASHLGEVRQALSIVIGSYTGMYSESTDYSESKD
jgi:hypothetical protein